MMSLNSSYAVQNPHIAMDVLELQIRFPNLTHRPHTIDTIMHAIYFSHIRNWKIEYSMKGGGH